MLLGAKARERGDELTHRVCSLKALGIEPLEDRAGGTCASAHCGNMPVPLPGVRQLRIPFAQLKFS